MANIIISTHWSDGDVIPFISTGKYLKEIGHQVTIFTHCCYEEKIRSYGMNFVAWDTLSEYKEFFNALTQYSNTVAGMKEIDSFRAKYENENVRMKEYELLRPHCEKKNTILIAKNRSSVAALLLAEKLNIPLLWVYMNPYEYESIENFNNLKEKELVEETNSLRARVGLNPIDSWLEWQNSPKKKIGFWPSWFRSEMINEIENVELIGFPLKILDKKNVVLPSELESLLKEKQGAIIISGGSSNKIKQKFYEIAARASIDLGKNVILATKYEELLPTVRADNLYIFTYIPLYECLAYADLIIHHGGIGTTSNAINTAVPQIILGDSGDTPLNGSIIKKIGAGDYLPPIKWTEEIIIEKIKELLKVEHKNECEKFLDKHREEDTFKNIENIINKAINNDEYKITYESIKKVPVKNRSENKVKNKNALSNEMKRYLLERKKKERIQKNE